MTSPSTASTAVAPPPGRADGRHTLRSECARIALEGWNRVTTRRRTPGASASWSHSARSSGESDRPRATTAPSAGLTSIVSARAGRTKAVEPSRSEKTARRVFVAFMPTGNRARGLISVPGASGFPHENLTGHLAGKKRVVGCSQAEFGWRKRGGPVEFLNK